MDKIWDVLKEKLESPALSNYFIGLILFNRNVVYTALTIDYHDKINGYYVYKNEEFDSIIELLKQVAYDDEMFCWPTNLYLWPILYAIVITGGLPYIKIIFQALSENADLLYDKLRVIFNRLKTVPLEKHIKLDNYYLASLKKIETLKNENDGLTKEKSLFDEIKKELDTDKKELIDQKNIVESNFRELETKYYEIIPYIEYLLKGIWTSHYVISNPSSNNAASESGDEIFKIVNGNQYHVQDTVTKIFSIKFWIENYQFEWNKLDKEKPQIIIKFNKVNVHKELFARCEWIFLDKNNLIGGESLHDSRRSDITATRIPD
jgi:hypothetical protein